VPPPQPTASRSTHIALTPPPYHFGRSRYVGEKYAEYPEDKIFEEQEMLAEDLEDAPD
jgi:hypothetical protein